MKSLLLSTALALLLSAPALAFDDPFARVESAPSAAPSEDDNTLSAAALVNDEAITMLELRERIALIMATSGIPDTEETRAKMTPQVLKMLIDEHLQLQEAKRLNIPVSDEMVQGQITSIEENAGKAPGSLVADIKAHNASVNSLYAQLRAQAAWGQIMIQKIRPRIRVSNEEATREASRQAEAGAKGGEEVNLTVLTLPVEKGTPEARVKALAQQMAAEVKKGAPLQAIARQLANSGAPAPTAGIWVAPADLDPALAAPLKDATKGQVIGPVRTKAGYQLVQVNDTRAAAAPDGAEVPTEILLKQILFALQDNASDAEVKATLAIAREVQKNPGTCADNKVSGVEDPKAAHLEVSFLRTLFSKLPEQIQPLVRDMSVGTITAPFATRDGIQMLVLCEKIEQPQAAPSIDEKVKNKIFREKMEREAMKYLRDLRRAAVMDIRL